MAWSNKGQRKHVVEIVVCPPDSDVDELEYNVDARVAEVLEKFEENGTWKYLVRYRSGHRIQLSYDQLVKLPNGRICLNVFDAKSPGILPSKRDHGAWIRRNPAKRRRLDLDLESSDELELSSDSLSVQRRRLSSNGKFGPQISEPRQAMNGKPQALRTARLPQSNNRNAGSFGMFRVATRKLGGRSGKNRSRKLIQESELSSEASESSSNDDNALAIRRRPLNRNLRRSLRSKETRSMKEPFDLDIPEAESEVSVPASKFSGAREAFKALPIDNEFRKRHMPLCASCFGREGSERGFLVFCQGCSFAYHRSCIGQRSSRDHLVTKAGDDDFVLQCRSCIQYSRAKEQIAPQGSYCQVCRQPGLSCSPFRSKKTAKQEQKEREENGGQDPVVEISPKNLYQAENVVFRCLSCYRAWHFGHLDSENSNSSDSGDSSPLMPLSLRHQSATKKSVIVAPGGAGFQTLECQDCSDFKSPIDSLVAWRPLAGPVNAEKHFDEISEDDKEYLVKWLDKSHHHDTWMPGAWVWRMAAKGKRSAFLKAEENLVPKKTAEEAIPEECLSIDIVLDVEYWWPKTTSREDEDLDRIHEVKEALVKFKGLGYEDAVWEKPPDPEEDPQRWQDFEDAYADWVAGFYVHLPHPSMSVERVKRLNFGDELALKSQPPSLVGGKLMEYQLDGINWLYYQWHRSHNAILADEMGLGKTIQVIGFLATLQEKQHCWPFLVVVPNSTCQNWRRELKQWAPNLRTVAYYGRSQARSAALKYELFHPGTTDLKCHVVITSYQAAEDDSFKSIFRHVKFQALVVDEGQRLKNDGNVLYQKLSSFQFPFKVLLTGTPLQNNQRELFNLLQFLDPKIKAKDLEVKYANLTKENIAELHTLLKPFTLRRTKAQVLGFLVPMSHVIIPVSMSGLEKEIYKSVIAKNADLLKAIFHQEERSKAKTGLKNIMMQLRKCLCHPFVYNIAVEEKSSDPAIAHRRLVEASSKLQVLEAMLPRLREKGHRVLIFSQFLDMLTLMEDFLRGLDLEYARLDGNMDSIKKQKEIDLFNAKDSNLFAFLLSTRAGGVGINLATADTVIILDPDFNPHQDMQAIARAHRIGQEKRVRVFQFMARASVEEKIIQIGKKKMALDHVLIEALDQDEPDGEDLFSILRFGAEALFKDGGPEDIKYDAASVEKLLDRSHSEAAADTNDGPSGSQFSFAKVWQNASASLKEETEAPDATDEGTWGKILEERARNAKQEDTRNETALGRGKRRRKDVDYSLAAVQAHASSEIGNENEADGEGDFRAPDISVYSESPDNKFGQQNLCSSPLVANQNNTEGLPKKSQAGIRKASTTVLKDPKFVKARSRKSKAATSRTSKADEKELQPNPNTGQPKTSRRLNRQQQQQCATPLEHHAGQQPPDPLPPYWNALPSQPELSIKHFVLESTVIDCLDSSEGQEKPIVPSAETFRGSGDESSGNRVTPLGNAQLNRMLQGNIQRNMDTSPKLVSTPALSINQHSMASIQHPKTSAQVQRATRGARNAVQSQLSRATTDKAVEDATERKPVRLSAAKLRRIARQRSRQSYPPHQSARERKLLRQWSREQEAAKQQLGPGQGFQDWALQQDPGSSLKWLPTMTNSQPPAVEKANGSNDQVEGSRQDVQQEDNDEGGAITEI